MISIVIDTATGYYSSSKEEYKIQQGDEEEIQKQLPGKSYPGKEERGRAWTGISSKGVALWSPRLLSGFMVL